MKYPSSLSTVFDFGKYNGKTIEEVCEENPSYIAQCLETVDGFSLDAGAKRYHRECLEEYFNTVSFEKRFI